MKWIALVDWDEEGKQAGLPYCVDLPENVAKKIHDPNDYLNDIGDWLSNEYGFCHYGFELRSINT